SKQLPQCSDFLFQFVDAAVKLFIVPDQRIDARQMIADSRDFLCDFFEERLHVYRRGSIKHAKRNRLRKRMNASPTVGAVCDRPQFVVLQSSELWAVIDRPYSRNRSSQNHHKNQKTNPNEKR